MLDVLLYREYSHRLSAISRCMSRPIDENQGDAEAAVLEASFNMYVLTYLQYPTWPGMESRSNQFLSFFGPSIDRRRSGSNRINLPQARYKVGLTSTGGDSAVLPVLTDDGPR